MVGKSESRRAGFGPGFVSSQAHLVDILQWRAVHQPRQIACRFLPDQQGNGVQEQDVSWDYAELHRQACAIAAQLDGFAHQPVMLALPAGLDFVAAFCGCLYASAIAVPVPIPDRHQGLKRWQHIVTNAQPRAILTPPQQLSKLRSQLAAVAGKVPHKIDCFAPQQAGDKALSKPQQSPARSSAIGINDIALLQYTSGSTCQPRGVRVSHHNLMHNLSLIHTRFGHSPDSHAVIWLPPHHDMGLIGGVLQPLYGGYPVTLMSPATFLRQPIRWLQAISEYGGTTSGGPNFAYERCLRRIKPEQRRHLDLSGWDLAFTGAEPVRAETLNQFADAFASCGFRAAAFYPCYGLAEATLFVSGGSKLTPPATCSVDRTALSQGKVAESQADDAMSIVSCGQVMPDQQLLIVNPQSYQPCGPNQIGEVWLAGPSVAEGYWQQPEASKGTFEAALADGTGPFLRTGDLGFWREEELFVTGRLKDLIIIRGQNHYPQDIEQTVAQSHDAVQLQSGAAFSVDIDGEERLIVAQEVKRTTLRSLDADSVTDAIRAAVSRQHRLQVHAVVLLKPGSLPKTTSGKVQRLGCKVDFQENTLNAVGRWSVDKTEALIQWLRQYASESINSRLMDERRCLSPGLVLDFGNQGLLGMQVPVEYEGLGLGHKDMLRVLEQLGAIDLTLALFVGLNNVLGIRPILQSAHPEVRADWLPQLATGRELAAFALTESMAGSNPNAIQARAVADANHGWRLYGEKIWSGSAAWAGIINVFVQHPEASGISGFAISKGAPGLRQGPEALTLGMRGMVQNTVYLDGVPVSEDQLLGQPGGGMAIAQDAMMYGRLAIAAACLGGMKRCAQLMLRYSSRRIVSTGRLLDNPVLLTRLGGLTAKISALSALLDWIAQRLDGGSDVPAAAYTACKILAPEFYWQAADDLVQCLGGRGYIETNLAPQILRDARVLRIFEGPTETLAMHLGAQVLNPRAGLKAFLSQALGASAVAERLFAGAEKILARYRSIHADAVTARRWAYLAVGELGAIAILLAAQQKSGAASPSALEWTDLYFEQRLAQALAPTPSEAVAASAVATAEWVASYADTIGNIEQTLTGEEHGLDALLKDGAESRHQVAKVSHPPGPPQPAKGSKKDLKAGSVTVSSGRSAPTAKSLQRWLMDWLAHRLSLSASEISVNKAFADYGVDSVMAVELAQDLEEFLALNQPLDVTLAWNFPTISALAEHLAGSLVGSLANHPVNQVVSDSRRLGAAQDSNQALDPLSETEMADMLAAELAAVQGRQL